MLLLLLAGCGGDLSSYIPTVTFSRFDVQAIDFEHIDTDFVFSVNNPNPISAPLDRFQYDLTLMDVPILTGDDPNGLTLVADGSSDIALPVSLNFADVYTAITAATGQDNVNFGLAGDFGFDTDIGPIDITYDQAGDFPAPRAPKFTLGKLKVTTVGTDSVGFGLDVDVSNDLGSAMPFSNMALKINFAGVQVGDGTIADVGTVDGATTQTLNLPFSVNYAEAVDALTALSTGQKLSVTMAADVTVGTPFGDLPLHVDQTGKITVTQ